MSTEHLLPQRASVVVIGAGVVGASTAWHLARAGAGDVVVLERAKVGAGTTWHSAGNLETWRADPLMYELVRYAKPAFAEVEAESGLSVGLRTIGRVMFTDVAARMGQFEAAPALGRAQGITMTMLDPSGVAERLPIIDPATILGGLWIPEDGRVDPTGLAEAYARAARRRGVKLFEDAAVTGIETTGGRVSAVVTDGGRIVCDAVVIAAGLWSRQIAALAGVALPLQALEHLYLLTRPIAAIPREMPMFLSYDDQLYGREDVGGLLFGSLDSDSIPIDAEDLPGDFAFGLLLERWDQFETYMARALRRFPCLATAEVRTLLNGPESFTPDGLPLVGELRERPGLWVAAAMNSNGIALSAGIGRLTAEWLVKGAASLPTDRIDVARFTPAEASRDWLRGRIPHLMSFEARIHGPGDDSPGPVGPRQSSLHDRFAAAGAVFVSARGVEDARYLAPDGAEWRTRVDAEVTAASIETLIIDRAGDRLFKVAGPIDGVTTLPLPTGGALAVAVGPSDLRRIDPAAIEETRLWSLLLVIGAGATDMARSAFGGAAQIVDPQTGGWLLALPVALAPSAVDRALASGARLAGSLAGEVLAARHRATATTTVRLDRDAVGAPIVDGTGTLVARVSACGWDPTARLSWLATSARDPSVVGLAVIRDGAAWPLAAR